MFCFGLVMMLQGFTQNFSGLVATRFFLGLFEAGTFPGCFYLLAMFYKRSEAQKRYSFFFSSTSLAGAFGGLLASAIGKLDGLHGYRGWRWIFILEGVLTIVVSSALFFLISDFPEDAKFLTPEEREFVRARLHADVGDPMADKKMTWRDVLGVFRDWKIIIGGFMYLGLIVPAYGFAYFSPTIIKTFDYTAIQTQLHSVPPWAAAFVFAMLIATLSDMFRHRFLFAMIPIFIAISGFGILLSVHDNHHVQYGALFLVAMGCYSAMPVVLCWFNTNLGGHHRRAVGTAWQVGFGNIGGIVATYSFLAKDSPKYTKGYAVCMAFVCLAGLSCCVYVLAIFRENRKRDRAQSEGVPGSNELTEGKGDLDINYRYYL
jgi:MFS family permease